MKLNLKDWLAVLILFNYLLTIIALQINPIVGIIGTMADVLVTIFFIMRKSNFCGKCEHMTNIAEEERVNSNVMGGCFIDGHITFTDCKACKNFKKYEKNTALA